MSSIQRALNQKKKTQKEIERENFERSQSIHIQKAITNQECAPKEKHIRAIILGTFNEKGAPFFYSTAVKLPLQGHPITCWKFLYVINKIIRNGHNDCVRDSMKYVSLIADLGRLWQGNANYGHLKLGYGPPIAAFVKLIVQKLRFHRKYVTIPGNLSISSEQLTDIVGRSVETLFELSVDLLDYMEELMNFQDVVLSSLDKSRSNSMTPQGQCKLTPLIQVIQDSAVVYDCLVKILFKLHKGLPGDTLSGHRERFFKQYRALQIFFRTSQTLQYFKNLLQVPSLPENPPNFLIESELSSHQAPVVTVSQDDGCEDPNDMAASPEEPSSAISLIDVGETQMVPHSPPSLQDRSDRFDAVFGDNMGEFSFNGVKDRNGSRDDEINRLKAEIERLNAEHKERVEALLFRIKTLEENVKNLVQLKEKYEEEIEEFKANSKHQDEQGKVYEEKFKKMRDIYTKLRDEHVDLLRNKAAITKELEEEKKKAEEKEHEFRSKCDELAHIQHERLVTANQVEESSETTNQKLAETMTKLMDIERSKSELQQQLENMTENRNQCQDKISALEARVSELEHAELQHAEQRHTLEASLSQNKADYEASNQKVQRLESQLNEASDKCLKLQDYETELERLRRALLKTATDRGALQIKEALGFYDSDELMSCKGSAEYLLTRIDCVLNEVESIEGITSEYTENPSLIDQLACSIGQFSARLAECLIQGKITSHSAPSVHQGDELVSACKITAEEGLNFLAHLGQDMWESETILGHASSLLAHLKAVQQLAENLRPQLRDVKPEEIGDLVDQEMRSTTDSIEQAEQKFRELLEKSREGMSGIQLEVNERILDSCTQLMNAIKILVEKSKVLQREIIAEGRGTLSAGDFYKKHHRWTEGLISAAKAVGFGATTLLEAADKLLSGEVSFEKLIVCSQDIAASTAQLVVASRVKANPKSFSLQQLQSASKEVALATGNVVASSKNAAEIQEQTDIFDFNKLTLTQAKKMEIDSQVRVLQLETEIEKERKRLGELRKKHYQLASDSEQLDPAANHS